MNSDCKIHIKFSAKNVGCNFNYYDKIDSLHCIVGENGAGKTRLLNSIIEKKNSNFLDISYESGTDEGKYSVVKFSASVELGDSKKLRDYSFDVSTSAMLRKMNLIYLNREDSINQVKVIIDDFKKEKSHNKDSGKLNELIKFSNKRLYIKLTPSGEGIHKYKKSYFSGDLLKKHLNKSLKRVEKVLEKNFQDRNSRIITNILIMKFFSVLTNEIIEVGMTLSDKRMEELYSTKVSSLFENINYRNLSPKKSFYSDLKDILNINGDRELDAENVIKDVKYFFKNLKYFTTNIKSDYDLSDEDDKAIIENFLGFITSDNDNKWTQTIFSVLEFKWKGLSSGELALLNLFGRLNSVENQLENNVIVLIDEVDLGMHPEWQRKWIKYVLPIIGDMLKKENRSVHVILTTHSPIILSDILTKDVRYLLNDTSENELKLVKKDFKTFGQNIYSLFENSFFLEATKGGFSHEVIKDILTIFGDSNEVIVPKRESYKIFVKKYNLNFDEKIPTEKIKKFFEDFVEGVGEDIIRKHLKLQIRDAKWSEEVDTILKYEQQIKWYQEQIKKIRERKNDKNNDII
jgi:hypothetical protein